MTRPQTIWANFYNITLYKGLLGGGGKISSVHIRILANGFDKASSVARRAKVGSPMAESRGGVLETPARGLGSAVSSPSGVRTEPRPPKDFPAF